MLTGFPGIHTNFVNTFFENPSNFFSRSVQISRLPPFESAGVSPAIFEILRSKTRSGHVERDRFVRSMGSGEEIVVYGIHDQSYGIHKNFTPDPRHEYDLVAC